MKNLVIERINMLVVFWSLVAGIGLHFVGRLLWPELMPDWVLLGLLYWSLALPMPALYWAVGFGLVMDAVTGAPFGIHALAYLAAVQLCLMLALRVRQYRRWQQSLFMGSMLLLSEFLQLTLTVLLTENLWNGLLLLSSIAGVLVWPAVFQLLRHLRRNYPVE